jgi:hypothetical protein
LIMNTGLKLYWIKSLLLKKKTTLDDYQ